MRISNHSPARLPTRPPSVAVRPDASPGRAGHLRRPAAHPDVFEAARAGKNTASSTATKQADVKALFREQFGALAQDKTRFHDTLRGIFGEKYDTAKAEQYRQKALTGEFDWLPPVQWVDANVLGGAHGAYDSESGTVLLNRELQGNPSLAASTYVEEAGHHLDTKLNTVDTPGDEGELFRRILGGEKLTRAQVDEIRAENDKGTIQLNGRSVEVEFWKPFKFIAKAVSGVVKSVVNTVKEVGNAIVSVGKGVVGAVVTAGKGLLQGVGGFFSNLVRGKVADAFQSLVRGADMAFLQAPQRIFKGVLNGAESLVHGASNLLGPLGKPLRALGTRAIDAARTLVDTGGGIMRDLFRTLTETPLTLLRGVEESVKLAAQGQWRAAAGRIGKGLLDTGTRWLGGVVDIGVRALQGTVNAGLTLAFAEKPSRGLSASEIQALRKVYGNSVDYSQIRIKRGGLTDWTDMAPHVVGNTIYMRNQWDNKDNFNPDGSLTAAGLDTLVHETGHVWQNQNGGGDFVHRSLLSQATAALKSGSRDHAYAWRQGFAEGKSFEELNPEQQADLMEEIGEGLLNNGSVDREDWTPVLTAAELEYVQNAWKLVKRGEGAR